MSAPQPSVGRIVHYRSRGSADGVFPPVCRAAIVTEVDPDPSDTPEPGQVYASLAVLNPTGLFFDRLRLHDPDLVPGTWHWHTECPDTEAAQS